MKLRNIGIVSLIAMGMTFGSCGEEKQEEDTTVKHVEKDEKGKEHAISPEEARLIRNMFSAIPSPYSLAKMLKDAGADYNSEIVHDPETVTDYHGEKAQALNLGIYGADMNFANLMDQKAATIKYMGATLTLYEKLGISNAIEEDMMERMQAHQDNKDTMMRIVTDAYSSLEGYLKENDELELAAYITAGGVVEALYIASHVSEGNTELMQRVADQKYAIHSLIELLEKIFENTDGDKDVEGVLHDVYRLQGIYETMEVSDISEENKVDDDGVMVIGAKKKIEITEDQLAKIRKISGEIREKYITP